MDGAPIDSESEHENRSEEEDFVSPLGTVDDTDPTAPGPPPESDAEPSPLGAAPSGPGWKLTLALFVIINAAVLLGLSSIRPEELRPEMAVGERFVNALVDGADGETRSGYARARDLMTESLRQEYALGELETVFEDRIHEDGFLEEARLEEDSISGTSTVRVLHYRFSYAGTRGGAVGRRFEVVIFRAPEGPRISAFRFLD